MLHIGMELATLKSETDVKLDSIKEILVNYVKEMTKTIATLDNILQQKKVSNVMLKKNLQQDFSEIWVNRSE